MKLLTTKQTVIKVSTLFTALILMVLVTSGCKRSAVDDPGSPVGPSGSNYYIIVSASPSVLPSNTGEKSSITAFLRYYDGTPLAGKNIRFEITSGISTTNIGTLSTKAGVTDGNGAVRTVYTVPKLDVEGIIDIRAVWTDSPWTERYFSLIPISLRYKDGPPIFSEYPVATFTIVTPGPYKVKQEITFDGKDSSDPDGIIVKYIWDFGDSRTVVDFESLDNLDASLNQPIVTHRYKLQGGYIITLKVVDNTGLYDVDQQPIKIGDIAGLAPTSCYSITTKPNPTGGYSPDTDIIFDATCSSDPDGVIRRYDWDWGDGKFSYNGGRIVTHSWHKVSSYPVSLTVTDDSGLKGVSSQNILIGSGGGANPTASFTFMPTNPDIAQEVVFDATLSSSPNGVITAYNWSFGDTSESSLGPIAYHAYNRAGYYTVVLTVTDSTGLQGVTSATVPVAGGGPGNNPTACFVMTPDPSSGSVVKGDIIKFSGSCSTDPDGEIRQWRWDLGDGTVDTTSGTVVTHAYSLAATFTVFLTVTDDDGLTGVVSRTFKILSGIPPVADAGSTQTFPTIGLCATSPTKTVSFNGSGSSDADGHIVSYDWSFGDGTSSGNMASPSTTHTYTISTTTTFNITLTVTDDDGLMATDTTTVTIACT